MGQRTVISLQVLLCLGACILEVSCKSYFPADVKKCDAKDPFFNQCLKDSANKIMKYLADGMKTLNAIPMDPLIVNEIILEKGNHLIPSLFFNLKNVQIKGWKDGYVTRFDYDPNNMVADVSIFFPKMRVNGLYELDGSVISIPVQGRSDFDLTYEKMTFTFKMFAGLENREGQNYLVIQRFDPKFRADNATVNLRNMFDDPEASRLTNNLLNSNIKAIMAEGWPVVDSILGDIFQKLLQRILDKVPYDSFFADSDESSMNSNAKSSSRIYSGGLVPIPAFGSYVFSQRISK